MDVGRLEEAIQVGKDADVEQALLGKALGALDQAKKTRLKLEKEEQRQTARRALQIAMDAKNADALSQSIEDAARAGVENELIFKATQVVKELKSQASACKWLSKQKLHFLDGSAELTESTGRVIERILPVLAKHPELPLSIQGHRACPAECEASSCRDDDPNDDRPLLSYKRALSVAKAFRERGSQNHMETKGWGCRHHVVGKQRLVRILATLGESLADGAPGGQLPGDSGNDSDSD